VNFAQEYQSAADALVDKAHNSGGPGLHAPINFLYAHALELAFKGFLRAHGYRIDEEWKTHDLAKLYRECRKLGLTIGPDDPVMIGNIVELLNGAFEDQAFRYFSLRSIGVPEITWTREVMGDLMRTVKTEVEARCPPDRADKGAVKLDITFGKPQPKNTR